MDDTDSIFFFFWVSGGSGGNVSIVDVNPVFGMGFSLLPRGRVEKGPDGKARGLFLCAIFLGYGGKSMIGPTEYGNPMLCIL
jgi:hypothetical protein